MTVTPPPAPDYALSVNPGSANIGQGGNQTNIVVTITRTNFAGAVTLSLGGAVPAGVTAVFAPAAPTGATSTMTLTVGAQAPMGTHLLQINGTGGPGARNTPFTLTITAPSSFTLGIAPVCNVGVALQQGALDDSRLITITRSNFSGNIALTAENLPAGLTASFAPNPAGGNTARLTLSASGAVATGTHSLTIRGTGPVALKAPGAPASLEATATLPVVVSAGPAPTPNVLEYKFSNNTLEGWAPGFSCSNTSMPGWGVAFSQEGLALIAGVGNPGEFDAWISKELSLPVGATALQFDASAHFFATADARLRVRVVDGAVSTTLFNQVITHVGPPVGREFSTKSVNVAQWAGKTVRIFFEQDDDGESSHEQIWLDNIRILSSLPASWVSRKQITVSTGTASAPTEYALSLVFDHAALVAAGKALASGNDVRVVRFDGTSYYELDRVLDPGSSWNSTTTRIWFQSQGPIAASSADNNYYLYYGNPAAGLPPDDRRRVFPFHDHFESGTLDRWREFPSGLWTEDNTRVHAGAFSAMYPAEAQNARALVAGSTNELGQSLADGYFEAWWNLNSASTAYKMDLMVRNNSNGESYRVGLGGGTTFGWSISKLIGGTFTNLANVPATPPVNTWFRVGAGMYGNTLRMFVDGVEVASFSGLTELGAGNVGLSKFEVPPGASWWFDDVITRRYVFPEPGSALGSEQSGPFAAGSWMLIRG